MQIVETPHHESGNWAWDGVRAIEEGLADGYWGNGMRAELGVKLGIAKVLLDVRRGDGPGRAAVHVPGAGDHGPADRRAPEAAAGAVRAVVKTQRALRGTHRWRRRSGGGCSRRRRRS